MIKHDKNMIKNDKMIITINSKFSNSVQSIVYTYTYCIHGSTRLLVYLPTYSGSFIPFLSLSLSLFPISVGDRLDLRVINPSPFPTAVTVVVPVAAENFGVGYRSQTKKHLSPVCKGCNSQIITR